MPPPIRGEPAYFNALPPFLRQPSNEGRIRFHRRFDPPERYQDYLTRYYRLITEVDEAVGRMLDELEAQDATSDTVVLFIGDNGYFQADRGLADKWYPYAESIRVPLLVRDPSLGEDRRGQVRSEIALNIDLASTVVAAARAAVPDVMQGSDLAAVYLADAPPADWRDEFFYEHPTITSRDRIPSSVGVVRGDWKYVFWPEWDMEQLFNLRTDPGELANLATDRAYDEVRQEYRRRLEQWRARAR